MPPAKPTLDLLRSLTDAHVLQALMGEPRLTRAELAERTGISKPTVSESVRRLEAAGVVLDTGARTTGRGGVGTYYTISDAAGCALVIAIAPEGVVAETIDPRGTVRARATGTVERAADPVRVRRTVRATARRGATERGLPVRLAVVSAADPVDRRTGRLVHLPDAPFLLGELSPVAALDGLVVGPVLVDNDVNWAARAERNARPERLEDFGYLYLGDGLGCAIVADGVVLRGHGGLAGEIAHLVTVGARGEATAFTEVFAQLGLRRPGTKAFDVDAVRLALDVDSAAARETLDAVAAAISGVVAAIVALADPEVAILGGPWGADPRVVAAVDAQCRRLPRPVAVRAATVVVDAPLVGARQHALEQLRSTIAEDGARSETLSTSATPTGSVRRAGSVTPGK